MKAAILINNKEYEINVSKQMNKLILESNEDCFPWDILQKGTFNVKIKPSDDEIGCGECSTCLTPIC